MDIKLYIMAHKEFEAPKDEMYVPLQVGSACAKRLPYLSDDSGDNISVKNPNYCELTGMYWLWKNEHTCDYIGICHYRRYLINEQGMIFSRREVEGILSDYDIITTKLLTLTCSYYHGFGENHHLRDLQITGEVVQELYPDYYELFDTMVHDVHTYFGNIMITTKPIYDAYCTWLFEILTEVEKRVDMTGYNNYNKRLFGFLSEFLQTVWIRKQGLKVYECMVGMLGEKYETRQIRMQLADYFAQGDYKSAESFFLSCYKTRPDILMEASDVTGELHLCMQVISTASYEQDAYHHCILDKLRDYSALMHYCHTLNEITNRFLNDMVSDEDMQTLKNSTTITPIAVEISVKMYCKEEALIPEITQKMCQYLNHTQ